MEGAARQCDVVLAQQAAHLALDAAKLRETGQQLGFYGSEPTIGDL